MEIHELKYFISIASGLTLEEASEEFNISPSSISKGIRKVEQELGQKLVDRSSRRLALTPAGKYFYDRILPLDAEYDDICNDMRMNFSEATIRVCAVPSFAILGIFDTLKEFNRSNPDIRLSFSDKNVQEPSKLKNANMASVEALKAGNMDFLIMHRTFLELNDVSITELFDDRLVAIMDRDHPLAQKKTIRKEDLVDYDVYMSEIAEMYRIELGRFPREHRNLLMANDIYVGTINKGIVLCMASEFLHERFQHIEARIVEGQEGCPIALMYPKERALPGHMMKFYDYIVQKTRYERYSELTDAIGA